tara:strand:- start:297 stop:1064 length:768 start_codon:yes stop_codon:yes gene_type:complete
MKNIEVIIDENKILENINLELYIGENIALIGPNGSGKSSIINLINRTIYPVVKDCSVLKVFEKSNINIWNLRSKIGFVNTDIQSRLKGNYKSIEIVLSGLEGIIGNKKIGILNKEHIYLAKDIMNKLALSHLANCYYGELSDGQKRKLLIARALINQPRVLILDEPNIGLDIKAQFTLLEIIEKLSSEGVTILVVTNNLEYINRLTTKLICMKSGKIFKQGSPSEIINSKLISDLYDSNVEVTSLNGYWRTFRRD